LKFRVKNQFYFKGKLVNPGDIVEVKSEQILDLKSKNVLDEPIVEIKRTATRKPKETRGK
jgi:hypothetical protein